MLIQVLGPGCAKCSQLAVNAEIAAKESGVDYVLEKVMDMVKIISFDVLTTPALVVDGKVLSSGKLLTAQEIKTMILEAKQ